VNLPARKILLELRPALDGHAGIPQETRLLFRALTQLSGVQVEGLLQSSTRVLATGLPAGRHAWSRDRQINRLSRVVVSLQTRGDATRLERVLAGVGLALAPARALSRALVGLRMPLSRFEPEAFRDFVWRALFERTLPPSDFDLVTSAGFRVARLPWTALHAGALATRKFGHALYPQLDTKGVDVMIAETPYPGRVRRPTRLIVRYHDAIPLLMPHTISDKAYHQASHYQALRRNVQDGAWFACVSDATRNDLVSIFPEAASRAVTIPNMVSRHYYPEAAGPQRIPEIMRVRRHAGIEGGGPVIQRGNEPIPYLLMVSTIEPRKNHLTLLAAWEHLRASGHGDLQLVFIGSLGWDHKSIVKRFRPWLARGGLHLLEDVPSDDIRLLYRHARITVCPSFGEGFDYSGVEAMCSGGVVAASDIPVHREVFGDAAAYFSPYSAAEMAQVLDGLMREDAGTRRDQLAREGGQVAQRYRPDRLLPAWQAFIDQVCSSD
jgi:glycosyltransferase involved in cell wall biosynthesis